MHVALLQPHSSGEGSITLAVHLWDDLLHLRLWQMQYYQKGSRLPVTREDEQLAPQIGKEALLAYLYSRDLSSR